MKRRIAPPIDQQPILADATQGAALLAIGERSFHTLRKRPDFPKPVFLSAKCVRWRVAELAAWAESLDAAPESPEPAQLRRGRASTMPTAVAA